VTAPFEFATAARIVAGPGRAAELPGLLAGLGSRVLVCTGADPARHAGLLAGLTLPPPIAAITSAPCRRAAPTAAWASPTVGSAATGNTAAASPSPASSPP